MNITEVRVSKATPKNTEGKGVIKAWATITIDGMFVVTGLKVIETPEHTFVGMPSRRRKDGSFVDTAHPISQEGRKLVHEAVMAEYEKVMAESAVTE